MRVRRPATSDERRELGERREGPAVERARERIAVVGVGLQQQPPHLAGRAQVPGDGRVLAVEHHRRRRIPGRALGSGAPVGDPDHLAHHVPGLHQPHAGEEIAGRTLGVLGHGRRAEQRRKDQKEGDLHPWTIANPRPDAASRPA